MRSPKTSAENKDGLGHALQALKRGGSPILFDPHAPYHEASSRSVVPGISLPCIVPGTRLARLASLCLVDHGPA